TEMALGRRQRAAPPNASLISAAREAELARLPQVDPDVRNFWADYLLGRSRVVGMELLASTAAYRNFMELQAGLLRLGEGQRVVDLGSGTGDFSLGLGRGFAPENLTVLEIDFLRDALNRARTRRKNAGEETPIRTLQCVGDLDLNRVESIPVS